MTLRHHCLIHGFIDFQELYQSNHGMTGNHTASGFMNGAGFYSAIHKAAGQAFFPVGTTPKGPFQLRAPFTAYGSFRNCTRQNHGMARNREASVFVNSAVTALWLISSNGDGHGHGFPNGLLYYAGFSTGTEPETDTDAVPYVYMSSIKLHINMCICFDPFHAISIKRRNV